MTSRGRPAWPRWSTVLRMGAVAMAVAVIALIVRQLSVDWSRLGDTSLRETLRFRPMPFAASWVVQTVGWLVMVGAWRSMLGQEGAAVSPVRHLRAHSYSGLTQVLPGSLWTPVSRVALYRQEGVATLTVSAAVVVEWLLVGLAGLLLYGVSLPWSQRASAGSLAWLVLVGLLAAVLLYPPNFARALGWAARRLDTQAVPVVPGPLRLLAWFCAEVVVLTLAGVSLYFVMLAVGPRASLADAMAAFGLAMAIANLLAWLPATSVLREGAFVLVLTPFYGSVVVAVAVTVVWRIWVVIAQLSWAACATVLVARDRRRGDGTAQAGADGAPRQDAEADRP